MKKIFTLALIILSYTGFANPNDGKLSITNLTNESIFIEVDGKKFTSRGNEDVFVLPDMVTGYHTIKVSRYVYTKQPGRNELATKKQMVIFQKNFTLKPRFHVDIVINRFGKAWYDELSMSDINYSQGAEVGGNDRDNNKPPYDANKPPYSDRNDDRNNNDNRYGKPMSDQTFAALKDALTKERFDNSRVTITKQVIDQNYFTVDQVKQIVQLYSFDNYKLDLAKYAYKNTVNKQDYFLLYDVFSFSNSKEDLANYIKQYK